MSEKLLRIISIVLLAVAAVLLVAVLVFTIMGKAVPDLLWNSFMGSLLCSCIAQLSRNRKLKDKEN